MDYLLFHNFFSLHVTTVLLLVSCLSHECYCRSSYNFVETPPIVQLTQENLNGTCYGVLVNESKVLTTASCLMQFDFSKLTLELGLVKNGARTNVTSIIPLHSIVDPRFVTEAQASEHDIAIVELMQPVHKEYQPIGIRAQNYSTQELQDCFVMKNENNQIIKTKMSAVHDVGFCKRGKFASSTSGLYCMCSGTEMYSGLNCHVLDKELQGAGVFCKNHSKLFLAGLVTYSSGSGIVTGLIRPNSLDWLLKSKLISLNETSDQNDDSHLAPITIVMIVAVIVGFIFVVYVVAMSGMLLFNKPRNRIVV